MEKREKEQSSMSVPRITMSYTYMRIGLNVIYVVGSMSYTYVTYLVGYGLWDVPILVGASYS